MYKLFYLPILVKFPGAINTTSHNSASLSGWIVQVTVMLCVSLYWLGVSSTATASVTEGATANKCTYNIKFAYYIMLFDVPC